MTLSRWRRIATGVAAGVIVMCAALIGASFRSDSTGVSVAAEVRPSTVIPIEIDPDNTGNSSDTGDVDADADADAAGDAVDVTGAEPDAAATDSTATDSTATDSPASTDDDTASSDSVQVIETDDLPGASDADSSDAATPDASDATTDDATTDDAATDDVASDSAGAADTTADQADTGSAATPVTPSDGALGTGGGVDDAECALDRLVIYAGARRSGVAGSMRSALAQSGFGAGCSTPVTVLASNCPLQFAGVLAAGSDYDPNQSFVASSASVDRETMTAVMGQIGYAGSAIDILDFSFVNPDKPGEQWMAVFIPPSFSGWETLSNRAGVAPTNQSLCAASGNYAG